jgi:hypothetical protein
MTFEYPLVVQDNAGIVSRVLPSRPPDAHTQAWSTITATPTTLVGYGITDALALSGGTLTGQLTIERDVATHVAVAASVLNASVNGTLQYRFQRTGADFLGSFVAAWRGGTTNNRINIETYGNGDSVDPLFAVRGTNNGSACAMRSTYALAWTSSANASTGTIDVQLVRDAANVLALRNALNPQAFLIDNTWTSSTNRETGYLRWASDVFLVGTEKGTLGGSARSMELQTDGITRLRVDTDYQVRVGDQGANAPSLFTFSASTITTNGSGRGLTLYGRNNVTGGTNLALAGEPFSTTSGASVHLFVGCNFAPTSGTSTFTVNRVTSTINQTGGANGITRGVSVEPTLTAAADWRSFDTMVNTGWAYHSSGTAPSRLGGGLIWTPFTTSQTPAADGQFTVEMLSNTAGNLVYRGNDGTTRRSTIPFAYLLPTTDGTNGQVLQTNGSGVLSFGSVQKTITSGTAAPSGGVDGDIYLQYV